MPKRGPKPADKPSLLPGVPSTPAGLNAAAKKHWERLTGEMAEAGLLSRLDLDSLTTYIGLWSRREQCERELNRKPRRGEDPNQVGPVILAINGYWQQNPWQVLSLQLAGKLQPFYTLFGLGAAARNKLTLPEPEEKDDKWDDL